MASSSAWGIEIGSYALKAVRLERNGDDVSLADFAYVPHKKVLSTPDVDGDEMIRLAIGQFMSQQPDMRQGPILVSVPGNGAFARFAKLPPVEPKKVPDIVKFEAVQQIPFPIEEVEWDYETFTSEETPEVEVGIFAITKGAVQARLNLYNELGLVPDGINISPVAAYNALQYDMNIEADSPGTIILDIGTTSTDLIIAEGGRTWIRTFPIGGHNFTDALINSFKLTYSKAEKLKSEAQTSKYRRQILSAMRPVFGDLAQDVQRSIGYYQSLHRDANLTRLIGVGSTFKLPGLRKFLSQQVQMEISRLDEFKRLSSGSNAVFAEHILNSATAYGLALQGLGMAAIDVNLIPVSVVRDRLWSEKIKWFGAAAALVVFGSMIAFARPMIDQRYNAQPSDYRGEIEPIVSRAQALKTDFDKITQETEITGKPVNIRGMIDNRDVWPNILADVSNMLASAKPQPELLSGNPDEIASIPPAERRLLELKSLDYTFVAPRGEQTMPQLRLRMRVESSNKDSVALVNKSVIQWLGKNAERPGVPYRILRDLPENQPKTVRIDAMKTPPAEGTAGQSTGGRGPGRGSEGGFEVGFTKGRGGEEGMAVSGGVTPGGGRYAGNSSLNLDSLAPLPTPAATLPPDTDYYQVEVSWIIQLVDPNAPATTDGATGQEGK
ncbi:MAG: type IV pilus assembly protein PilM [Phycisphaerales bacterium]|nr:type IV pilus assembly protein PilM [Phycisphaerales bacterium]